MKRFIFILLIFIMTLFTLCSCNQIQGDNKTFLVQIIPNKEQINTDELANALNFYLSNLLSDCNSDLQICEKIEENWDNIQQILNDYGKEYSAEITSKSFEEIVFNNRTLHKGVYNALIIDFGQNEENSRILMFSPYENGKTPTFKSRILQN